MCTFICTEINACNPPVNVVKLNLKNYAECVKLKKKLTIYSKFIIICRIKKFGIHATEKLHSYGVFLFKSGKKYCLKSVCPF
jgi:hypothetical protein